MTRYRDRLEAGAYTNGEPAEAEAEAEAAPEPEAEAEDEPVQENGDFHCNVCSRTFTTEHGLKIHQGKSHAEVAQ